MVQTDRQTDRQTDNYAQMYSYVKCNICGLVYLNPRLDFASIEKLYASEYNTNENSLLLRKLAVWGKDYIVRYTSSISKTLELDKNQGKKLLDIGCGDGCQLRYFKEKGLDVEGLEIDPFLVEKVRKKLGIKMYSGSFCDNHFDEESYDFITMFHSLEHCYDIDNEINYAYKILKSSGTLLVEVPNYNHVKNRKTNFKYNFQNINPSWSVPYHTVQFDETLLINVLRTRKFSIKKISYPTFSLFQGLPEIIDKFNMKLPYNYEALLSLATSPVFLPYFFYLSKQKRTHKLQIIAKKV